VKQDDGLTIVIDTREQTPWEFEGPTVRGTLSTGDYSVQGLEHSVAIERKSLADLIGSLTAGRDRFLREVERLKAFRYRCIVVEGDAESVWGNGYRSTVSPRSIIASTLAITCDHEVPVIWAGNRTHAEWTAEWLLRRAWTKREALGLCPVEAALVAVPVAVAMEQPTKRQRKKGNALDLNSSERPKVA
jgi:ERCC4-type nuclease